jgi:hypothetical protein
MKIINTFYQQLHDPLFKNSFFLALSRIINKISVSVFSFGWRLQEFTL